MKSLQISFKNILYRHVTYFQYKNIVYIYKNKNTNKIHMQIQIQEIINWYMSVQLIFYYLNGYALNALSVQVY